MSLITSKLYNRDLSWLRFNHRVLQEAADKRNPLYERIKFLAIYSSNLDEFFEVRVSDIRQIKQLDKKLRKKLITKPNRLLKEIKTQIDQQGDELGKIFRNEILPELSENGIDLIANEEFTKAQKDFALNYYNTHIKPIEVVKTGFHSKSDELHLENEHLYLISSNEKEELQCVTIPDNTNRFVVFPETNGRFQVTFIDDIMKYVLSKRFNTPFYSIKISRDAELYLEDEYSGSLLEKIESSLSKRETGQITRAIVEFSMPETLLNIFKKALEVNETDIVRGGRQHNLKDLFGFPNPTDKTLSLQSIEPKKPIEFQEHKSIFKTISKKDRLLYFPYESFDDVIHFVEEAAEDKKVKTIKMTLYRVSKDSKIANALLKALKNNKRVVVFIETKARFDEANNIKWGNTLEQHGAKVIYSYPNIKVHSKILYIEREEKEKIKSYGYIGTGNFNEKTAKIYTDFGLLTSRTNLMKELAQIFEVLERNIIVPKVNKLLLSPFNSRIKFTYLIEREIENAKQGKKAYIILKMNSLQDEGLIQLLYKANNAGVKIQIIVRGICCLVPGIKKQSEHISVISIVDRFLEHTRVFIFANDGDEKMYMGSADWMTRNIDHRIEVITPILDADCYSKMRQTIDLQLQDTVKARIIDAEQTNTYVNNPTEETDSSQVKIYQSI